MVDVKILGTGCSKCKRLEKIVRTLCQKEGIAASIEKVEDINKIIEYGVVATPGLVVDGEVKAAGRIPRDTEIISWLKPQSNQKT